MLTQQRLYREIPNDRRPNPDPPPINYTVEIPESIPSQEQTDQYWLVAIAAVAVLSLAYSALIMERISLGFGPIVLVLILYAVWRALAIE